MKILGMDYSYKTIILDVENKRYELNFKSSLFKGIHDIRVFNLQKGKMLENKKEVITYSTNKGIFSDIGLIINHIWNEVKINLYIALEKHLFKS